MRLVVSYLEIEDNNGCSVIEPPAWRVALDSGGEWYEAILFEFSSERDAERAKRALEQAGLTTAAALRHAGQAAVLRTMVESLAW